MLSCKIASVEFVEWYREKRGYTMRVNTLYLLPESLNLEERK